MKNGRGDSFTPWADDPRRDCSFEGPVDADGVAVSSSLDRQGRELPDNVPMSPPVGMSSGPSLADFVQRMIQQEVSRAARAADLETFEEADDFDIEDDPVDERTPYETEFDKAPPANWPMWYDPRTGVYGQLPPEQKAPDGFVQLEREFSPPKGFSLPRRPQGERRGGEEASHQTEAPAAPPSGGDSGGGAPISGSQGKGG